MKRFPILFTLMIALMLLALPDAANAQTGAWQVVIYHETVASTPTTPASGEFIVMTESGVTQSFAIPQAFFNPYPGSSSASFAVSSDLQWGVGILSPSYTSQTTTFSPVQIFNLQTGACCTMVNPPYQPVDGLVFGNFSLDNRQVSAAYVSIDPNSEAYVPRGGLITIDVTTGVITAAYDFTNVAAATGIDFTAYAHMGKWEPSGVRFVPSCYACEGVLESNWWIWNPANNQITESPTEYFYIFGSTLDVTGELLYTTENRNYPVYPEPIGMFAAANVVEYYLEGTPYAGTGERYENPALVATAPIVYFDPSNLNLPPAEWVADGRGFVMMRNDVMPQSVVVLRDGTQIGVASASGEWVIAGTPTGWLTQDNNSMIYDYRLNGTSISRAPVIQLINPGRVVLKPELGAASAQPFQTVNPPPAPPTPPQQIVQQCPGFLPSRLIPGGVGRVTPGDANNMRAQPNLNANRIGAIPGGASFNILQGPVCDGSNGIAWWQVNYNGVVGWTAEGQGNIYWLEPVN